MTLPQIKEIFSRNRRSRFLSLLDITHLLICVFIIGLYAMLLASGVFERVENNMLDFFFRQKPVRAAHASIVIVEIDQESLETIGAWPWPWAYHAEILQTLEKWHTRVLFDFYFKETPDPEEELNFLKALQEGPPVYLPVTLQPKPEKKIWVHGMPIVIELEREKKEWIHSLPVLEKETQGLGHLHLTPDSGGVVRRVDPYQAYGGESYFYLPIKAGSDILETPLQTPLDLKIPVDRHGKVLVHWNGPWQESFRRISYADLVRSIQALEKNQKSVIDPTTLKNKIFLIGLTASEAADFKTSPLDASLPALAIHAQVLSNVLTQTFLKPTSLYMNAFWLCVLGFIAAILFVVFGNVASFVATLLMAGAWVAFCFFIFAEKNIWLYSVHPVLLILTLFIFSAIYHQIRSLGERQKLFDLATRDGLTGLFVIRHFREMLNQSVQNAKVLKQPLSVILIDLDNFKKINDAYGHPAGDMVLKKCAQLIQQYFRSKRPAHQIDFSARYGGEEFIIMLRNAALKEAGFHISERIRKAIEAGPFEWEGQRIPVTISLGVATLHPGENIPDMMVRRADEALYRAKKTGKNRVCLETFATG